MKKIIGLLMLTVIVSLAIVSCKDDFNEQDFLKLQSDLKLKQDSITRARSLAQVDSTSKKSVESYVAALNEAGNLMAVTIVVRDNNVGVSGVTVTLSSGTTSVAGGRTQAAITATTDANGNAIFDRVPIGRNSVSLTKTGYVSASAYLDFGTPGALVTVTVPVTLPNGSSSSQTYYLPPQKRYESLILPLFSKTGVTTAIIKGKVTIETDVTNTTPEIPQNLTISADVSALATAGTASSGSVINGYRFDDAAFGTATVNNTTGEYSMVVPASLAGSNINLIFPAIEADQKIAIAYVDDKAIATGPEYRNVSTVFGPSVTYDAVPFIRGAKVVFNAPPAAGSGFAPAFTVVKRALETGTISALGNSTIGNTSYLLATRGKGYASAPTVTITAGGGTGATATSSLRGFVTSANITAGGAGYTANTNFDIQFTYTDVDGNVFALTNPITVISTAGGVLPTGALTLPNSAGFWGHPTPFTTSQGAQGLGVRVVNFGTNTVATATTQATVAVTRDTELNDIVITKGGADFTSAPTITLSGGGTPTTQAAITVSAFRTQFDIALGTGGTGYKILPKGIVFSYPANAVETGIDDANAKVDLINNINNVASANQDLISQLTTNGNSISAKASTGGLAFRTNRYWTSAPAVYVQAEDIKQARAGFTIDATTGELTFKDPGTDTDADYGSVTGLKDLTIVGSGYDAYSITVGPSATGAPGTGASFLLTTSIDITTKKVTWSGATTKVSGGSGYLQNLNQQAKVDASTTTTVTSAKSGQTYVVDFKYGTGKKKANVLGSFYFN